MEAVLITQLERHLALWEKADNGVVWPSLGGVAVSWIEHNCVFGEGERFGEPAELTDFQKALLWRWYEYHEGTEREFDPPRWRFNEALIGFPRGEGKTQFLGWIIALEFAGPAEIAPRSPSIPLGAASFEQADLVYTAFAYNFGGVEGNIITPLSDNAKVQVRDATLVGEPGRVFRVAAKAGTNEGGNATFFGADELHEWHGAKARVFTVLRAGTRKRSVPGRTFSITTAGVRNSRTLAEDKYEHGLKVMEDQSLDPGLLVVWCEPSDRHDLTCRDGVRDAILEASPNGGVLYDIKSRVDDFFDPTLPRYEAERYFLNRWTEADEQSWLDDLPPGHWIDLADITFEIPQGAEVTLSVDAALRNDSVAVGATTILPDGRIGHKSMIWSGQRGGERHDQVEIVEFIIWCSILWDVKTVVYDPAYFELAAQTLEDRGLAMLAFPQSYERMAPACTHLYELIADRQLVHDGQSDLARHVSSAVWREGERGRILSKRKSANPIDGVIAMAMGVWEIAHDRDGVPEPWVTL